MSKISTFELMIKGLGMNTNKVILICIILILIFILCFFYTRTNEGFNINSVSGIPKIGI